MQLKLQWTIFRLQTHLQKKSPQLKRINQRSSTIF